MQSEPLFQSVADEIGVLRTDLINDVYDFAKIKWKITKVLIYH